jgi:hypothetical protein
MTSTNRARFWDGKRWVSLPAGEQPGPWSGRQWRRRGAGRGYGRAPGSPPRRRAARADVLAVFRLTLAFVLAEALDVATTILGWRRGFTEGNPLLSTHSPAAALTIKVLVVTLVLLLAFKFLSRHGLIRFLSVAALLASLAPLINAVQVQFMY